jgi:hypothetical protein
MVDFICEGFELKMKELQRSLELCRNFIYVLMTSWRRRHITLSGREFNVFAGAAYCPAPRDCCDQCYCGQ